MDKHTATFSASADAQDDIAQVTNADEQNAVIGTIADATAVLRRPQLWQQASVQTAWLQALQALLSQCQQSSQGRVKSENRPKDVKTNAKRRKTDNAEQLGTAQIILDLSLAGMSKPTAVDVVSLDKRIEETCMSVHEYLDAGRAADSAHAPSAAPQPPETKTQTTKAGKKRKSTNSESQAMPSSTLLQQQQQQLLVFCHIKMLLDHAADIAAQHLHRENAEWLALLMLHTQAWLTQHLLSPTASPASSVAAAATAASTAVSIPTPSAALAASQQAPSQHVKTPAVGLSAHTVRHMHHATELLLRCVVTAQGILADCLKAAPDAVATRLLLQLPSSWQMLTMTNQLVWRLPKLEGDNFSIVFAHGHKALLFCQLMDMH